MHWRNILAAAGFAALAIGGGYMLLRSTSSAKPELAVVSFGGAYQKAQHDAYMAPFARITGTNIVETEYNGDYGILRERASAPAGVWDVVSVESGPALRGQAEGIFLPVPDRVFSGLPLVAGTEREAAAGHLIFSTIMAFPENDGSEVPASWADFWDLEKFPGKRGLRNNPRGTLEIALLADGADPAYLYPLDVERALRKLDTIRDHLVFWDSGAQPIQLLANRTVAMTSVYNGRAWAAHHDESLPIAWSLKDGLLEFEYWAVPQNAPHPDLAFDFIRFSLEKQQQANFANQIAYIPTNADAQALVSESIRAAVPDPAPAGKQVTVDAAWWAENEAEVSARWQQWTASK